MSRILITDDSPLVRREVRRCLELAGVGSAYEEAADGLEAFRMMVSLRADLVVTDLQMPRADATKLLALRAAHPIARQTPVLVLTANADPASKASLLDLGASDCVSKPFHGAELVARARVHLRLRMQESELRRANARLEQLARTDALTGLANRRSFDEAMEREIERVVRYGNPLSLVALDLDHFKRVNDTHGHAAGDLVLAGVAEILSRGIRGTDIAARLGGEELALLLPETGLHSACVVAQRLRAAIAVRGFRSPAGEPMAVSASLGIASADQLEVCTADGLCAAADLALYAAKRGGRNRVVLWDPAGDVAAPGERSRQDR